MIRAFTKLVPAVLFLFTALAAQAAEPAASLLLRLQGTAFDELSGTTFSSEDLIYRDGLVISRTTASLSGHDPWITYGRAKAPAEALQELKAALSANHVGLIHAPPGCKAVNLEPDVISRAFDLTWFGKNNRQNRFSFSSIGVDVCPQEINNLFIAIDAFFRKLVTQDSVRTQR